MQFVLAASDADASAQEPESPSDALSSETAQATLNLTTVAVLFVGVATLLLLRPERTRTGITIAAVAAIAALLLPPVPIPIELDPRAAYDVASDIDLGTVNLTAALSLLLGVLAVLRSNPASMSATRGMVTASGCGAAVLLIPPMPTPVSLVALTIATGLALGWLASRKRRRRRSSTSAAPTVGGLYVHPVKSCAGLSQPSATLDRFGFVGDRRLMLVGEAPEPSGAHAFLTQRQLPKMALIACSPAVPTEGAKSSITLRAPGVPELTLRRKPRDGAPRVRVRVWDNTGLVAVDMGDAAAAWLSAFLGTRCRLVSAEYLGWRRPLDDYVPLALRQPWRVDNPQAAFADGYPLLLTSEESLAELNERLRASAARAPPPAAGWWSGGPAAADAAEREPLGWDRFRPNIVVRGCAAPFEEDTWKRIRINGVTFRLVKGCSRCKITTTEQRTGVAGAVKGADGVTPEPLATLQEFREKGAKGNVYFGQNLVHEWPPPRLWRLGRWVRGRPPQLEVRVGDVVEVLERGAPVWDRAVTAAE